MTLLWHSLLKKYKIFALSNKSNSFRGVILPVVSLIFIREMLEKRYLFPIVVISQAFDAL